MNEEQTQLSSAQASRQGRAVVVILVGELFWLEGYSGWRVILVVRFVWLRGYPGCEVVLVVKLFWLKAYHS